MFVATLLLKIQLIFQLDIADIFLYKNYSNQTIV